MSVADKSTLEKWDPVILWCRIWKWKGLPLSLGLGEADRVEEAIATGGSEHIGGSMKKWEGLRSYKEW